MTVRCIAAIWLAAGILSPGLTMSDEPPAINPFGARSKSREDAIAGYAELSNGLIHPGKLYVTRDVRLKIFDAELDRQREIPLRVVARIECKIEKEWMEKEWRFKENANDEKFYTGRAYPARLYLHTVTLNDGRQISGPLSGIIYVEPYDGAKTEKFLLHKRQKGPVNSQLDTLVYLRTVALGENALREGQLRKNRQQAEAEKKTKRRSSNR